MPWKCKQCGTSQADTQPQCATCKGLAPKVEVFQTDERVLNLGSPIHLSWIVQHADEVSIDGEKVEASGLWKLMPRETTTYTLVASNEIGEVRATCEVSLPPPEIKYFKVAEKAIQIGRPSILHWEVENAEQVFIDRGVGEVSNQSFTEAYFDRPGPVVLRAVNASGEVTASVVLSLPLPEINAFYASDPIIRLGEPSVLHWDVVNFSEISIDQEIGDVSELTRVEVYPDRTTRYTLCARNVSGEVRKSLELTLPPPKILHFGADSELATEGRSVNLFWQVENAYKITIDHDIGEVTHKSRVRVKPDSTLTTYILTATGHSGEAQAAVDVSIFPIPMEQNGFIPTPEISTDIDLENENFDLSLPPTESELDLNLSLSDIEKNIKKRNGKKIDLEYYKKMEITEDLLELEKPSLRKEIARIYKKVFKPKVNSKHKR